MSEADGVLWHRALQLLPHRRVSKSGICSQILVGLTMDLHINAGPV